MHRDAHPAGRFPIVSLRFFRSQFIGHQGSRNRPSRPRCLQVIALEARLLLSGSDPSLIAATDAPVVPGQTVELYPWPASLDDSPDPAVPLPAGAASPSGSTPTIGAKHPLSAVPVLNSLPGAPASLYLDFTGDYESSYGGYKNISTPAFDQDGDPTTFSDGELAAIQKIWSYVAEDYAPFNLNVTTVPPVNMAHGATEKVVIGGTGSWTGGAYGGYTYVGDFAQTSVPNIAFVFSGNLADGNAKYTGDAVSHESGHGFGLEHQSVYSGTTKTAEYFTGPGDGTAPLMGDSYAARRSLWWYGQSSSSSTTMQDDMAVISGPANGFGYRPDTDAGTVTPLAQSGAQVSATGLIITTSDVDYYGFSSGAGVVSFTVTVPTDVSNLAPMVELLSANGSTIIASAGPSATDFSASITATVPAAGSYLLVVASSGGYDNVGHYSVNGTIVPLSNAGASTGTGTVVPPVTPPVTPPVSPSVTPPVPVPPTAVTNLSVTAQSSNRVVLTWQPTSSNAQGYLIARSINGRTWITVGTLGAGSTGFTDTSVGPNKVYYYSVRAFNAWGASPSSQVVRVRTPKAVVLRQGFKKNTFRARPHKAALPAPILHQASAGVSIALQTVAVDRVLLGWRDDRLEKPRAGSRRSALSPR
jgi:hypothetical protein